MNTPSPIKNLYQPNIGPEYSGKKLDLGAINWSKGVLIRTTNWLGDNLMTLPAIYKLSRLVPSGAPVSVICRSNLSAFWKTVDWVNDVIPFSGRRLDDACKPRLHDLDPGLTVVLPNSFGSAWDLWRADVPDLLGRSGRGRTAFLNYRLPAWRRKAGMDQFHEVRKYLEIAAACGCDGWDCTYPAITGSMDNVDCSILPDELCTSQNLLVMAPGAAYGPAKQWPADNFNVVARRWAGDGGTVVAVGAPGEEQSGIAAMDGCAGAISLVGKTSLHQLMYVLSKAKCVLANDSGAMHLAAALGKRGVAIFGSTDPIATGPIGGKWIILNRALSCSPCLQRTCGRTDIPYECLESITPDTVTESLVSLCNA